MVKNMEVFLQDFLHVISLELILREKEITILMRKLMFPVTWPSKTRLLIENNLWKANSSEYSLLANLLEITLVFYIRIQIEG